MKLVELTAILIVLLLLILPLTATAQGTIAVIGHGKVNRLDSNERWWYDLSLHIKDKAPLMLGHGNHVTTKNVRAQAMTIIACLTH